MLTLTKVRCFKDLTVIGVNGVEYTALKGGHEYEALESTDKITVFNTERNYPFFKINLPLDHIEVL